MDKFSRKKKIIRFSIIILVVLLIFLAIYLPLKLTGVIEKIKNLQDLKNAILGYGIYSYLIFFGIQILQCTILPIPASVTTLAGVLIFGPLKTFLISIVAVLLGSLISFFIGKKLGKKVVDWVVGSDDSDKWSDFLNKGKYTFFLMMLFPFFPDDILCIVAGTTNMSYKFFITTILTTRPIVFLLICYFGSGQIIPFNSWGIPVWIALIIIMTILIILSFKYKEKIENYIIKISEKIKNKK